MDTAPCKDVVQNQIKLVLAFLHNGMFNVSLRIGKPNLHHWSENHRL